MNTCKPSKHAARLGNEHPTSLRVPCSLSRRMLSTKEGGAPNENLPNHLPRSSAFSCQTHPPFLVSTFPKVPKERQTWNLRVVARVPQPEKRTLSLARKWLASAAPTLLGWPFCVYVLLPSRSRIWDHSTVSRGPLPIASCCDKSA